MNAVLAAAVKNTKNAVGCKNGYPFDALNELVDKGYLVGVKYPGSNKSVDLTDEKETELIKVLEGIKKVIERVAPPESKKLPHCRSCSYYELCWVYWV